MKNASGRLTSAQESAPINLGRSGVRVLKNSRVDINPLRNEYELFLDYARSYGIHTSSEATNHASISTIGLPIYEATGTKFTHMESNQLERTNCDMAQAHMEGTSTNNRMENVLTPFMDISPKPLKLRLTKNAILDDETDPSDSEDDMSWESVPSTGLLLDEAHPLRAFKAKAIQAVLQGYMEYQKKHEDKHHRMYRVS